MHYLHPDIRIVGAFRSKGILGDELRRGVNCGHDIACGGWTSLVQISENVFEIPTRPWYKSNSHRMPQRFQRACMSSSETNSPRCACSSPSCTAARSSAVMMYR